MYKIFDGAAKLKWSWPWPWPWSWSWSWSSSSRRHCRRSRSIVIVIGIVIAIVKSNDITMIMTINQQWCPCMGVVTATCSRMLPKSNSQKAYQPTGAHCICFNFNGCCHRQIKKGGCQNQMMKGGSQTQMALPESNGARHRHRIRPRHRQRHRQVQ